MSELWRLTHENPTMSENFMKMNQRWLHLEWKWICSICDIKIGELVFTTLKSSNLVQGFSEVHWLAIMHKIDEDIDFYLGNVQIQSCKINPLESGNISLDINPTMPEFQLPKVNIPHSFGFLHVVQKIPPCPWKLNCLDKLFGSSSCQSWSAMVILL